MSSRTSPPAAARLVAVVPASPSRTTTAARHDAPPRAAASRRGPLAVLGDTRGLTATGALLLLLVAGGVGAAVELRGGGNLGAGIAVGFVAGCLMAALLVHREDVRAALVIPPLAYAAVAAGAALSRASIAASPAALLKGPGLQVVSSIVLGAPALLIGTGTALLVVLLRGGARRSRRA